MIEIGPVAYKKIRDKEQLELNFDSYMRSTGRYDTPDITYDEWLENSQKMGAEEIRNNMVLTRKLLSGETLYVTAKLSNGDTIETAFPIQPIRDFLIEKRPCGTDNDFDLLDEISSEQP
ncbi:MAG: hypothetical protein Pars93KO_28550 [Parasphingorhabdus sp.]